MFFSIELFVITGLTMDLQMVTIHKEKNMPSSKIVRNGLTIIAN